MLVVLASLVLKWKRVLVHPCILTFDHKYSVLAPSSFLLLVVMPGATSSVLLLIAMPFVPK